MPLVTRNLNTPSKRTLAIALLLLVAGTLLWVVTREPRFQGKPLSDWLKLGFMPAGSSITTEPPDAAELPDEAQSAIRAIGVQAIPKLVEWLESDDPDWKVWLKALLRIRSDPAELKRARAIAGFIALNSAGVPALVDLLEDPSVRLSVIPILWEIDHDPRVVPGLIGCLADANPMVRANAAYLLGGMKLEPERVVPALIRQLGDADRTVRLAAAWGLGSFGEASKPAVSTLEKTCLSDAYPGARVQAAGALIEILGDQEFAIGILGSSLSDETLDEYTRLTAARLLGEVPSPPASIIQALKDVESNGSLSLRLAAGNSLAQIKARRTWKAPE